MPSNIFANTGTNVSVIFLDKANTGSEVFLMDASNLGTKVKEGKNQRTVLSDEEVQRIIDTFLSYEQVDDFSVMTTYKDIEEKNYSFSAGQYFEIKIEYVDISEEEFLKRMNAYRSALNNKFAESHRLEVDIMNQIGGITNE